MGISGYIRVYQGIGYIGKLQATAGHLGMGISGYIRVYQGIGYIGKLQATLVT